LFYGPFFAFVPPAVDDDVVRADPEEVNNWNVFGLGLSLTAIILLCCVVWTMVTLAGSTGLSEACPQH
jgi:hypothetical protein